MDRDSAYARLRSGMFFGGLALFIFGAAFYVSVLYLG